MSNETSPDSSMHEVSDRRDISVSDIQALRESVGWLADEETVWRQTLEDALHVSSVYEGDQLVGVGFLVGTTRHAVLGDVCVSPDKQSGGVGSSIVDSLVNAANEQGVRYVTLTYDENSPWLEELYRKSGFEPIYDAMQLVRPETP